MGDCYALRDLPHTVLGTHLPGTEVGVLFQPLRKSSGVLFTAFPDTLRAFRLLRVWQRRALLRCVSDQGCWKHKHLRRIRSLRLCDGNRCIVGGKGQHRRDENSDSSGDDEISEEEVIAILRDPAPGEIPFFQEMFAWERSRNRPH